MSIIQLKPGESIKTTSKSFKLIAEKIKSEILHQELERKRKESENNKVFEIKNTEFQPKAKEKIIFEMKSSRQENDEEIIANDNQNILSKFIITEKYEEDKLKRIKSAVVARFDEQEKHKKYSVDVYKEKRSKFKEELEEKKKDFIKIPVDTHPKGRLDLEYRKYHNIKSRVVNSIPVPTKKETIYIKNPFKMQSEIYDLYDNQSWNIKDIQKFINLYFEYHKDFERIQEKIPNKKTSEIIALYDILNPVLLLKKIYKKCKRKSPANKILFLKSALPLIKEKLLFILKDKILDIYSNEAIITLGEASISRRDLVEIFSQHKQ